MGLAERFAEKSKQRFEDVRIDSLDETVRILILGGGERVALFAQYGENDGRILPKNLSAFYRAKMRACLRDTEGAAFIPKGEAGDKLLNNLPLEAWNELLAAIDKVLGADIEAGDAEKNLAASSGPGTS